MTPVREALPKSETLSELVGVVARVLQAAARRRRLFSCRIFAWRYGSGSRGGGGGVGSGSDRFLLLPPPNKHMLHLTIVGLSESPHNRGMKKSLATLLASGAVIGPLAKGLQPIAADALSYRVEQHKTASFAQELGLGPRTRIEAPPLQIAKAPSPPDEPPPTSAHVQGQEMQIGLGTLTVKATPSRSA